MNTELNGYVAFYKDKRLELRAKTAYEAQVLAATYFKAKKSWEVTVSLCELAGKAVVHKTDF